MSDEDLKLPPRIVHLIGGLRAVDDRSGTTFVQIDRSNRLFSFSTPRYPQLYGVLANLGLAVIGVEFVSAGNRLVAPDWWYGSPRGGFNLEQERRSWGEMRNLAHDEARRDIVDIARRCNSLFNLLAVRILQMSGAYNQLLRAAHPAQSDHMFDNTYVAYVEAAVHAFLSDAASLRDLLAEYIWRFVLNRTDKVTSFRKFRTMAAESEHIVAKAMLEEGRSGWIKDLSDLRNDVIHVAPIGASHSLPPCVGRDFPITSGGGVTGAHYGLLSRSEEAEEALLAAISRKDDAAIREEMEAHRVRLKDSRDALTYAWETTDRLVVLAEKARVSSGLKGKVLHLGPDDIIDLKVVR